MVPGVEWRLEEVEEERDVEEGESGRVLLSLRDWDGCDIVTRPWGDNE